MTLHSPRTLFDTDPIQAEEWRPVVGWEGLYEVSNRGRVKRVVLRKYHPESYVLKFRLSAKGYPRIALSVDGRRWDTVVHRLVAEAFIGPRNGLEVNHRDGDKCNNCVSNLEYVTRLQNVRHAHVMGLAPKKISYEQVVAIRERRARGEQLRPLATEFGVSIALISRIALGLSRVGPIVSYLE